MRPAVGECQERCSHLLTLLCFVECWSHATDRQRPVPRSRPTPRAACPGPDHRGHCAPRPGASGAARGRRAVPPRRGPGSRRRLLGGLPLRGEPRGAADPAARSMRTTNSATRWTPPWPPCRRTISPGGSRAGRRGAALGAARAGPLRPALRQSRARLPGAGRADHRPGHEGHLRPDGTPRRRLPRRAAAGDRRPGRRRRPLAADLERIRAEMGLAVPDEPAGARRAGLDLTVRRHQLRGFRPVRRRHVRCPG